MNIRLEARFLVRVGDTVTVACFRHAVRWTLSGVDVTLEIDDFTSEQDGRSLVCVYCEADNRD